MWVFVMLELSETWRCAWCKHTIKQLCNVRTTTSYSECNEMLMDETRQMNWNSMNVRQRFCDEQNKILVAQRMHVCQRSFAFSGSVRVERTVHVACCLFDEMTNIRCDAAHHGHHIDYFIFFHGKCEKGIQSGGITWDYFGGIFHRCYCCLQKVVEN